MIKFTFYVMGQGFPNWGMRTTGVREAYSRGMRRVELKSSFPKGNKSHMSHSELFEIYV